MLAQTQEKSRKTRQDSLETKGEIRDDAHRGWINDGEMACRAWLRMTPQTQIFNYGRKYLSATFGPIIFRFL
jgi:hypothetical protein